MPGVVKISEAASIALHAMVLMAANTGKKISAKDMSAALGVSSAHLAKVMQRLVKAGLAVSLRGPAGGFGLGRPSGDIRLIDIYESIEGTYETDTCLLAREVCLGGQCILGDAIKEVNQVIKNTLMDKSLAELTRSFVLRRAANGNKRAAT